MHMTAGTDRVNHGDQNGEWAVRADRIIDGTGAPPISDAVLVVRDGRIKQIGATSTIKLSPQMEVYNYPHETILPGFIDTHNHPTLKPIGAEFKDYMSQFYDPDARLATRAARNLRVDLLSGVTTIRVVGELNFVDVILAAEVQDGIIVGPNIIPSGPRLGPTGGHVWIPEWCVDKPENIRKTVRDYISKGSRLIKLGLLDESEEKTSYSDEELSAAVEEAHSLGVPVAVHCTGEWGSSILHCLKAGVDAIEHVVPLNRDIIQHLRETDTALSLTPFVYKLAQPQPAPYWHYQDFEAVSAKDWMDYNVTVSEDFLKSNPQIMTKDRYFGREVFPALKPWMDAVREAWEAGITICVGSDAPHGIFPLNVEFLVDCGIPPLAAIAAATGVAARVCRIEDSTGTLTPGKSADFISVRGNPIERIEALRDVNLIVRNGVRYQGLSFQ
jgi:imidazolonepropionase-like amidohydrolase